VIMVCCEVTCQPTMSNDARSFTLFRWAKISCFDPALAPVRTAYPSQPRLAFLDPPVQLARTSRPRCDLDFDRRVDFPSIRFVVLSRSKVPHI
jgi:hypothetical protein